MSGGFVDDSMERDEAIDTIHNLLTDLIGYADTFEARDFGRKLVDDALTQWMRHGESD